MKLLEIYDLNYKRLAILNDNTVNSSKNITLKQSINQIWELTFEIPLISDKFMYIVNENLVKWENEFYVIKNIQYQHDREYKKALVQCRHLSCGLEAIICDELNLIGESADSLITNVLENTGWSLGTVDVSSKYRSLQSKEQSVFSNLVKIAELFNGRLIFDSTNKTVSLKTIEYNRNIQIRKGKNLKSLNLSYDTNELVTVLYPFGATRDEIGEEVNIMSVNPTGKSYIVDYSYYLSLGYTQDYIQQHPELFTKEMVWRANEYVSAQDLYDDAVQKMSIISKPKVKCQVTGIDLSIFPEYFLDKPVLGERITIIDEDLNLNLSAQVISITSNYDNPLELNIEISNEFEYNSILKDLIDSMKYVEMTMTAIGTVKTSRLDGIIDIMKAKLNSTQSKWYTDNNGNLVFENVDNTAAMKLGGGIFAIANSKDVNGNWNWRTFGDGNGFVADYIVAGVLDGALIKGDSIQINSLKQDVQTKINKIDTIEGNTNTNTASISNLTTQLSVLDGKISTKVEQSTYETDVTVLEQRMSSAEQKIMPDSIVSTVKSSVDYMKTYLVEKDLGGLTLTRNAKAVNPLMSYNPTSINLINENECITISQGIQEELTYWENGLEIVDNKIYTFEKQTDKLIDLDSRTTNAESNITQLSNQISLKVNQDGVISAINMSPETIKISASKVDITGAVTFNSLDSSLQTKVNNGDSAKSTVDGWKYTGKTTINGGSIETGTITADKIKTGELIVGTNVTMGSNAYISWSNITGKPTIPNSTYIDAYGIYTGTINASQITAGTITGVTLQTATTGSRIAINSTNINYYQSDGVRLEILTEQDYGKLTLYDKYDTAKSSIYLGSSGYINVNASLNNMFLNGYPILTSNNWSTYINLQNIRVVAKFA